VLDPSSPETEVVVDAEKAVTAVFSHRTESITIAVQDSEGKGVSGVRIEFTDGSKAIETDVRGIAILNTTASSTIACPFLEDHAFEPQAAIVEKGDDVVFTASPQPYRSSRYYELTFNPVVFNDVDGKQRLNPFSSAKIREAMNRLIDRDYVTHSFFGESATPIVTFVKPDTFDHEFLSDVHQELEELYSYNKEAAEAVIKDEMVALGAELVDDRWLFDGEEVELVLILRDSPEEYAALGEYIAAELTSIGFKIDKRIVPAVQATQIWMMSDPRDGLWHMTVGGWISAAVQPLQGHLLAQFYTPLFMQQPLWHAYEPEQALLDAAVKLRDEKFESVAERKDTFAEGLELALKYSVRVWLVFMPD
jgi:hypothetical protein